MNDNKKENFTEKTGQAQSSWNMQLFAIWWGPANRITGSSPQTSKVLQFSYRNNYFATTQKLSSWRQCFWSLHGEMLPRNTSRRGSTEKSPESCKDLSTAGDNQCAPIQICASSVAKQWFWKLVMLLSLYLDRKPELNFTITHSVWSEYNMFSSFKVSSSLFTNFYSCFFFLL